MWHDFAFNVYLRDPSAMYPRGVTLVGSSFKQGTHVNTVLVSCLTAHGWREARTKRCSGSAAVLSTDDGSSTPHTVSLQAQQRRVLPRPTVREGLRVATAGSP